MEIKKLEDLRGNPKNPRKISKHDYEALVTSIKKFGDLSGIVLNVRTGQLVGGHQRTEAFKRMPGEKSITRTEIYKDVNGNPGPNRKGTIAVGYVWFENEQYAYREVDWDEATEAAANIAANRIQGQFDLDLLSEITFELSQLEDRDLLEATGQTNNEIESMLKASGAVDESESQDEKESDKLVFSLTAEQREIVEEALGHIKATQQLQAENSDSRNGAALYVIAKEHLDKLHGESNAPAEPTAPTSAN
jgi:hypothetical protein